MDFELMLGGLFVQSNIFYHKLQNGEEPVNAIMILSKDCAYDFDCFMEDLDYMIEFDKLDALFLLEMLKIFMRDNKDFHKKFEEALCPEAYNVYEYYANRLCDVWDDSI